MTPNSFGVLCYSAVLLAMQTKYNVNNSVRSKTLLTWLQDLFNGRQEQCDKERKIN